MKESELERQVTDYCKSHGMLTFKFVSPNHRGVPDRIIVHNGTILFVELKQPGKKPTKLQMHELARLRDHGGIAFWADNLDKVIQEIHEVRS